MKSINKFNKVVLPTNTNGYYQTAEELLTNGRKVSLQAIINNSVIAKYELGKSPIDVLKNSRTAVKRAKNEFKAYAKTKVYHTDRIALIHQITHSVPNSNMKFIVN